MDSRQWWRRTRDAQAYERAKSELETPMLVLAIVFTIALVIGEVGQLEGAARIAIAGVNGAIWAVFAVEYVWLLRLAPDRRRHVRTHVLDLLIVVLPFLRPLRVLRVFRILRLVRVVAVAAVAWRQVIGVMRHRGLGGIVAIVATLLLLGGLLAYAIEPDVFPSAGDAIWWVLVTSTTVGYGDYVPVGVGARAIAVVVMIVGVGLVGLITANIVDYMTTKPTDVQPSNTCPTCEGNADRLTRIEDQLARIIDRLNPPSQNRRP